MVRPIQKHEFPYTRYVSRPPEKLLLRWFKKRGIDARFELRNRLDRARKLTHADEDERRLGLVVNRAQRLRQIEPPHEAIRFVDEDRARMLAQHR